MGSAARGEAQLSHEVSRAWLVPGPAPLMGLAAAQLMGLRHAITMHAAPQGGQAGVYTDAEDLDQKGNSYVGQARHHCGFWARATAGREWVRGARGS